MTPFWRRPGRSDAIEQDKSDVPESAESETQTGPTPIAGERGIPSVNRATSLQSRVSSLMALGLMAGVGVGLLTWYYRGIATRPSPAVEATAAVRARAQGDVPLPSLGRIDAPTAPPSAMPVPESDGIGEIPPPVVLAATVAYPATSPASSIAVAGSPSKKNFERRLSGPAFASGNGMTPVSPPANEVAEGSLAGNTSAEAPTVEPMNELLRPSVAKAVEAQVLPTQRLLLPKGAFIDCTLETAIDSTLPGMTTCVTATDTYSVDGRVVLMERGTKLVGETRGQVQQGMARLFVLWTEARTPTGVVVPLASPGTDDLGRSGMSGQIDRHFWDRFGAAILISTIDGGIQAAVSSAREGGGTVIYNPSSSQDILTEVLKGTVAIPPTLTKPQGDRIQILVARDLDFRQVYQLRLTREGDGS